MSEQQKNSTEKPQQHPQKVSTKSHFKRTFFLFLLLVFIVAISVMFYRYNEYKMSRDGAIAVSLASLEATSARLEQQRLAIEELQQSMAKLSDRQVQTAEQINQIHKTQTTQPTKVAAATQSSTQLYELAYLLRMAILQLQFAQDFPAAQRLLALADTQIQEMADPRLIQVRKQIAQAQLTLKSFNTIDTDGILSQLNAIGNEVKNLPRQINKSTLTSESQDTATQASPQWRKALNNSLDYLGKIVVVRHQEQALQPVLSTEQQLLLEQNIQLLLQRAGWAVVMHKPSVYELSLQQVISTLESYYQNNPQTKKLIQALNTLKTIDVTVNVPDISAAWKTLQQLERQQPQAAEDKKLLPSQKGE